MSVDSDAVLAGEPQEIEIEDNFAQMGKILEELESYPDQEVRAKLFDLLDLLEAFHREAVVRIVQTLPFEQVEQLHQDPVIHHLLDTYIEEDEAPEDIDAMIEAALEEIRPYVHSHGGEMEALDVDKESGVVKLRLMGSCHGCPSSNITLTQGVETRLKDKWPGFRKLEVEGAEESAQPSKLLQINTMRKN